MKDIDFDELDKAVNSLMATTPSEPNELSKPSSDETIEVPSPTVGDQPLSSQSGAPVASTSPIAPASAIPSPSASRPAPATRRTGRFMDMVSSTPAKSVQTTTSREGLSVTPRSAAVTPALASRDEPTIVTQPAEAARESQVEPPVQPMTMPDPIDVNPFPSSSANVTESNESPFLADAKVEKRPLNADQATVPASESSTSTDSFTDSLKYGSEMPVEGVSVPQSAQQEDNAPPSVPQAPELSSELVAIESTETPAAEAPLQSEKDAATSEETTEGLTITPSQQNTASTASSIAEPAEPLGPSSIAPQYTPQPSSGDQSHAAIYDATDYPQAVAHPAKHKSSWWWVLWVVVLLAVGAGGAVALYYLGIIP